MVRNRRRSCAPAHAQIGAKRWRPGLGRGITDRGGLPPPARLRIASSRPDRHAAPPAIGDPAPEAGWPALRPYLTVAEHVIAAHPHHHLLLGAGSALARRVGETDLAIEWAERGRQARPSKLAEIWLGYAYRSAGRTGESLAALRRAVMYDPEDLSVYADIASTLADDGRLEDALAWVEPGARQGSTFRLRRAHRPPAAVPGATSEPRPPPGRARPTSSREAIRTDSHEHTDLGDCLRPGRPWLSEVPTAALATAPDHRRRPPSTSRPAAASVKRLSRVAQSAWPHPPAAYDAAVELVLVEPDELLSLLSLRPEPPRPGAGLGLPGLAASRHRWSP